ncbi:hypothetical protein NCS57_00008200 [Fusarium keratoplasticum]|uniref:Uncharacterized protein n=1 Tax=Fusarium keratoplasticum TaxID=1328300 RepID=A0ACC0RCV5_9HYPO|nr:hypothetical protein NCS57_00008200 [Fusarium keratoplasticum]KAI8683440.1 hypothetical protein NCS57_00008200 [Fusarium keratoplasticum]KAI8687560.1 hypothetical protein NCS55_00007700 [Fusarium keratoplasticum]
MSTQQLSEPTGLANLPCEIHLEIFSYLCPMGGAHGLVTACKRLYNNLIIEFYKESGPQLNWLPLLVAISQGNIDILDKCLKAGAPLNHRWPYLGEFGRANDPKFFRCCQPLYLATWYGQDDVLRWLVDRGAVATDEERPHFIESITADHLVSDVTTAEGRWKPVMYQQEACQQETHSPKPSPHFVWHSSELRLTDIFSRLLRLYKTQCVDPFSSYRYWNRDYTQSGSRIYLDNWIDWIWRDMLLSASDPVPILE